MTTVAGVDIGNATTEIVVATTEHETPTPAWYDRVRTAGCKGSTDSVARAADLLNRAQTETRLVIDAVAVADLQPVDTRALRLHTPKRGTGRLRSLLPTQPATAAGSGWAVGRHVTLDHGGAPEGPVVVSVSEGMDYRVATRRLNAALDAGWQVVGVLVAGDDAVLIHNRLTVDVPVVDEVCVDAVAVGGIVAVEVPDRARGCRHLADPFVLAATLGLDHHELSDAATLAHELLDAPAIAVTPIADAAPASPDSIGHDFFEVDAGVNVVSLTPDDFIGSLADLPPSSVRRARLTGAGGELAEQSGAAVGDAFAIDLATIVDATAVRRSAVDVTRNAAAVMRLSPAIDVATELSRRTGLPVTACGPESVSAAAGALTTPACPPHAVVCDIGGGTIDLIAHGTVSAAGAGELVTVAVANALRLPIAVAEHVKRGPAVRVDSPHLAHHEDGAKTFLDRPAPGQAIGQLCLPTNDSLVPFSSRLAAEEWRSIRLAIKRDTVGLNVRRCLRDVAVVDGDVLVLAGGGATDHELTYAVTDGLRRRGVIVGRANTAGCLGPRYAVAWGLINQYLDR